MTDPTLATVILVGRIVLAVISRGARRGGLGQMVVWLVITAGLIALVCLAIYGATVLAHRRRYNSHSTLFNSLCQIHGLDRNTRELLKQVVRHHRLTQPARLFTEPEWLDPANLRGFQDQAARLTALGKRLFAESGGPQTPAV